MTLINFTFIYFIVWWTVLFCVLPWSVKPSSSRIPGQVASAPQKPHLKIKFLITSLISFPLTYVAHWVFVTFLRP